MPRTQDIYTAYYYDQLGKLWVKKMCDRAIGINKIWPKEKPKRIYLTKMPVVKQPPDYYKQWKIQRLEERKVRRKLSNKKYYEKNRERESKKRLDWYYKRKKAA